MYQIILKSNLALMYYSARISYSTCIIDLLVIIIEMNLFQLASNKNIKKMCSLVTMVTYFPCMTAFSPLKVHGQTFGILHFDTLLCIFNKLINSWQFHSYHIGSLSSVIQINSTVDLYGNVLTCCGIFLAQNKLSSVTNETL